MRTKARESSRGVLLVLGLIGALAACAGPRPALHGTLLEPAMPVPDFQLASVDGPVARSDFQGKITVLVFGFTHCPVICPTTLARLARSMEELGPGAEEIQVVMITIDPERDTPKRMKEYTSAFAPAFLGLTGTREQITEVAAAFGIFHARSTEPTPTSGDYQVDHTTSVTVLDREGNARLIWAFGTETEHLTSDLRQLIKH